MADAKPLAGKTLIMSGGSRGIGLAIALLAAKDGANVTIIAKTDTPNPKLPGTIHTAAAEIEEAGGNVLAFLGDVRSDESVAEAVKQMKVADGFKVKGDWTAGCIAVTNPEVAEIFAHTKIGTEVEIRP